MSEAVAGFKARDTVEGFTPASLAISAREHRLNFCLLSFVFHETYHRLHLFASACITFFEKKPKKGSPREAKK